MFDNLKKTVVIEKEEDYISNFTDHITNQKIAVTKNITQLISQFKSACDNY